MSPHDDQQTRQYLLARFWEAALGFWRKDGGRAAWALTVLILAIALAGLALQYRWNVWHRAMFDAIGKRDRAVAYPLSPDEVDDALVQKTVEEVGLGHFLDRLDEDTTWEHVLSGGEKQRLAFARVLIQSPETIVMDEATAALDPLAQEQLMRLLLERLPEATVISVGHRPELEAFHTRKLVLENRTDGARPGPR